MTKDTELELWQQEWRSETVPLPELKKRIRRQNLQAIARAMLLCAGVAVSTFVALRTRLSFAEGMAAGMWFSALLLGGYAWWVRRGSWRPSAQTTQGYLELYYRRAAARVRTLRAATVLLIIAAVFCVGVFAWEWFSSHEPGGDANRYLLVLTVLLAMIIELVFLRWYSRRKRQEMEAAKKLLEDFKA